MEKTLLDYTLQQLKTIINIQSPSGYTEDVANYCIKELSRLGYAPYQTTKGGVIAALGGKDTGNGVLLGAHIDTLGAMVHHVKENGALCVAPVGGLQANNVETETATVLTRDGRRYDATFQLTNASVHVNGNYAKTERTFDTLELLLDEDTHTKEETRALGIETGDYVLVEPRFVLTSSGYIKSRYLDDKLSAAILLGYAKYLKDADITPERALYLDLTVFEEVGHGGASDIPQGITEMLAVDMGCVGESLSCTERMVSICAMDSKSPSHKIVVDGLVHAARANNIPYAIDVYPHYGSDADVALSAGYGIRHCVIGAGVYASHGYERSHIAGLCATFDLLNAYLGTKA